VLARQQRCWVRRPVEAAGLRELTRVGGRRLYPKAATAYSSVSCASTCHSHHSSVISLGATLHRTDYIGFNVTLCPSGRAGQVNTDPKGGPNLEHAMGTWVRVQKRAGHDLKSDGPSRRGREGQSQSTALLEGDAAGRTRTEPQKRRRKAPRSQTRMDRQGAWQRNQTRPTRRRASVAADADAGSGAGWTAARDRL